MSDDTTQRHGQDRTRINMSQEHEVRYWTEKLGVSKAELQDAIHRAGSPEVAKVREVLGMK